MKYITKFEAEQRVEQLEKRWGFGVFEDEKKKKPLMPNNVARGLVEDMLIDDLNPLEDLVHKHLKNHIERYGSAKDYDSLKIFKDFERQLVLPAVKSLDEKGSSMEDSEYSEFGASNWKSDDTSQVWSAMEMDAFVDEMYHEMINIRVAFDKHRSSSARLEKRWGFGVFDDDKDKGKAEKKNPPMPNNVARKLVASYIEDETFGEIEQLVEEYLARHVRKTGGVEDYDSSYTSDLYRDFERQIVMPTVHSLADLDNAEAEGYSPFNPKNWRNDDTAQVWSLIEMDDFVSDMWNTMKEEAEDGRSSSARLETREKMSKELRRLMEDYKDVGEALDKVLWDLTQKEEQGIAKDVWRNMVNILDERELPAMFDAVEKAMKTVSGMTVTSPNNMESFKKEANNFLTILDAYWSKEV